MPFKDCTDAYNHGVSDILRGTPDYAKKLDRDNDGIGCETKDAPVGFVKAKSVGKTVGEQTGKFATSTAQPKSVQQLETLPVTGTGMNYVALGTLVVLIGVALMVLGRKWVR